MTILAQGTFPGKDTLAAAKGTIAWREKHLICKPSYHIHPVAGPHLSGAMFTISYWGIATHYYYCYMELIQGAEVKYLICIILNDQLQAGGTRTLNDNFILLAYLSRFVTKQNGIIVVLARLQRSHVNVKYTSLPAVCVVCLRICMFPFGPFWYIDRFTLELFQWQ